MPIVQCKKCNNAFYGRPSLIIKSQAKYCSTSCYYKENKLGKNIKCFVCNKETYKQLKAIKNSKSGKFFCGKSCQTIWRNKEFVGEKHKNWKEGLFAYRSVLDRNNVEKACTLCNTTDVRILAVHHIDKNRKNNNVTNLAWLCHNCHFLVHHSKKDSLKFIKNMLTYRGLSIKA